MAPVTQSASFFSVEPATVIAIPTTSRRNAPNARTRGKRYSLPVLSRVDAAASRRDSVSASPGVFPSSNFRRDPCAPAAEPVDAPTVEPAAPAPLPVVCDEAGDRLPSSISSLSSSLLLPVPPAPAPWPPTANDDAPRPLRLGRMGLELPEAPPLGSEFRVPPAELLVTESGPIVPIPGKPCPVPLLLVSRGLALPDVLKSNPPGGSLIKPARAPNNPSFALAIAHDTTGSDVQTSAVHARADEMRDDATGQRQGAAVPLCWKLLPLPPSSFTAVSLAEPPPVCHVRVQSVLLSIRWRSKPRVTCCQRSLGMQALAFNATSDAHEVARNQPGRTRVCAAVVVTTINAGCMRLWRTQQSRRAVAEVANLDMQAANIASRGYRITAA